ncbi:phosphomannomutase/phosphoglucomutase [bacterium]|nr:phosphomannomutase/phosphoglucomutase [bacterium]
MSIFKAYDVRGIYPTEINEEWAYKIGRAFAIFLQDEIKRDDLSIVLAQDNRVSSDSLCKEVERGLLDQGVNVIKIELATTPMLYFGAANYGYDGGISVTASHNSKEYNGFKFVRSGAIPVGEDSGLREIEKIAEGEMPAMAKSRGETKLKYILDDYVEKNRLGDTYNYRVFIDTANGVAGLPASKILNQENFISIFPDLDGNFPNHDPDPLKKGSLDSLSSRVSSLGDLGISFDGDGDRVFFVDEKGKMIPSDLILALCAEHLLKKNKFSKILYDVRCSNIVKEVIEKNDGFGVISRVGHAFIKKEMRNQDILFGGEYSGHFYSKESSYAENPFLVVSIVLSEMKSQGKPVSEIIAQYKKYFHSGEINLKIDDKIGTINKIREKYSTGKISTLDGIRIDFDNWWLSLRASNTEPVIRLIVEAATEELLQQMIQEITNIIME